MSRYLIVAQTTWLLLLLAGVSGCMSFATTLRHPDGRTVICGPYPVDAYWAAAQAMRESQCIQDYQRQGFERVAQ